MSANDSANGNWVYTYDDFNRLISSTGGPNNYSYAYAYDRFGNKWKQTLNGGCTAGTSFCIGFDANNRMTNLVQTYDAAGNVLSDSMHTYRYDAENRLVSIDNGANTYGYDASGQRVFKTSGGALTDFIYDRDGHIILISLAAPTMVELYAAGMHLATKALNAGGTDTNTYFDHADWLGTERARTDVSGNVCETAASLPFGDGQTPSITCPDGDVSPMHFTGKERDSESGLDNFGARYFTSNMGRFMSPDPLGGHLVDPQTLNKYVYVRDNPVSLTDPTGLDFYLTCTHTDQNGSPCQQVNNGGQKDWVQGTTTNGQFSATVISNGANGTLFDQNGNQYAGSFSQNGVSFTSGNTTSNGVFENGSNPTTLSGSGIFQGFTGVFNDNCGGTCIASGSIFGTKDQFATLTTQLLHNPGIDAVDLFHHTFFGLGPQNYRYGNVTGPDPHLVSRGGTERNGYDQFHYDGSYPYATVPGFFDHAGSAFGSIGHFFTGPQELPPPTTIP